MKIHHHLITIITAFLLCCCNPARADWLSGGGKQEEQIAKIERELESQRGFTDQWEVIAGVLGVGCVLLLVIGTALGSKTRHGHASRN